MADRASPPLPHHDDPALLIEVAARLLSDRVLDDARAAGCDRLRHSDGYVFQHLVAGPATITTLAAKLAMTQQGASKVVADLEQRGYVQRRAGDDARVRYVELTDLGRLAVDSARRSRAAVRTDLRRRLGTDGERRFTATLADLVERLGGLEALRTRSLRPPT